MTDTDQANASSSTADTQASTTAAASAAAATTPETVTTSVTTAGATVSTALDHVHAFHTQRGTLSEEIITEIEDIRNYVESAIKNLLSNTRHHLGRMTLRTKVVSKKEEMVYAAIKLWCALTQPCTFAAFQKSALSIFR